VALRDNQLRWPIDHAAGKCERRGGHGVEAVNLMWVAIVACAVSGFLGAYVAHQKGRPLFEGIVFGVLLGPIGLLIAACLPTRSVEGDPVMGRDLVAEVSQPTKRPVYREPEPGPMSEFLDALRGK
jgi:hypothetical protein